LYNVAEVSVAQSFPFFAGVLLQSLTWIEEKLVVDFRACVYVEHSALSLHVSYCAHPSYCLT